MKALLKIDFILTRRMWTAMLLSILLPLGYFLLFSSIGMSGIPDPEIKARAIQNYLLTMTSFSISGFGFFTVNTMLRTDRHNNWQTLIQHSPVSMSKYYLSKAIQISFLFVVAITVNFLIGGSIQHVELDALTWLGSGALIIGSGIFFVVCGVLLSLIVQETLASVMANVLYFLLAIFGGSWVPVDLFPDWMKKISEFTPTYHINQLITTYAQKQEIILSHAGVVILYTVGGVCAILFIQKRKEVH